MNPIRELVEEGGGSDTEMTLRSPSSTSRSWRLSRSFLICAGGRGFEAVEERAPLADWAASRVSSRAMGRLARRL